MKRYRTQRKNILIEGKDRLPSGTGEFEYVSSKGTTLG